jgi:DNA-3-methyladenine glycosylase II
LSQEGTIDDFIDQQNMTASDLEAPSVTSIELRPGPPFRLDFTAWALRRRARNRIDVWNGNYRRAVTVEGQPLTVEVSQDGPPEAATVTVAVSGPPGVLTRSRVEGARAVIETSLGLRADLAPFYRLAESDRRLGRLVARFRGVKPPRFPTVFEALVNAVACQQLSLEVGIELLNRLTDAYGAMASGTGPPLTAFPEAAAIASATPSGIRQLGFSTRKAVTLIGLATAAAAGDLDGLGLDSLSRAEATAALQSLPGIGRWSAEYVLLRGLGRLDVYPGDDVGARNKLRAFLGLEEPPDYAAVSQVTGAWTPFSGMVYFHLLLDGLAERGFFRP